MYVLQSLPSHQQSLAGGLFNVFIRLSNTAVLGISTAVFSSIESTPAGMQDPMLKYTRTFQTSIALAAAGLVLAPFIKIGTQGNAPKPGGRGIEGKLDEAANRASTVEAIGQRSEKEQIL
jgi:hypothetical protein